VVKHQVQPQYIRFVIVLILGILVSSNLLARRLSTQDPSKTLGRVPSLSKMLNRLRSEPSVVTSSRLLQFTEDISNAWNASIIEQENEYLLVFRHETVTKMCQECGLTEQQIKMVFLDRQFQQVSPIKTVTSNTVTAEDARMHYVHGQIYLTCNSELHGHFHPWRRQMGIAKLDVNLSTLSDFKEIPSGGISTTPIEKNWPPFEYPEHGGSLYYIYSTSPYKIIQVDHENRSAPVPASVSIHHAPPIAQNIDRIWNKDLWGEIRGGSPARLVDGVYLTFFHSLKYCSRDHSHYYVMGAYIFQDRPPFKILAMTSKPIVFKDMYSAPYKIKHVYSIYPAGFAIEKKDGKTFLHVSCGENDTSIRIVSIDKDALLQSMTRLS